VERNEEAMKKKLSLVFKSRFEKKKGSERL
jgi:hypothetical protein